MYTVLFVCTGNTCRSPMAQAILTDMVCKDGLQTRIHVESAGISAREGDAAALETADALQRLGVKALQHSARRIENNLLHKADLVLTMTDSHRCELVRQFPEATARTYLLGEFAGKPGDVPDPIGGGPSVYDRCAVSLQQLIVKAWPKIRQLAGII